MKHHVLCQTGRWACTWVGLVICLAVILGGCGKKEVPLTKAGQKCKKALLAEMNELTTALTGSVAQEDWVTTEKILQTSFEKLQNEGIFAPERIAVLDRNGITQGGFPPRTIRAMDFSSYQQARIVYEQKKITPTMLYLEGNKIFVLIGPLLQKNQVIGAALMIFPDESLKKWQVSEQEFLSIDFNR